MFLYDIGIRLYIAAVWLVSPFNRKARLMARGHRGLMRRIAQAVAGQRHVVWIHAASVGEFEQGRPVIEEFRRRLPHYKILLTFFSPSGYELRKNYEGADWVFYLPYDTPRNARRFLSAVDPEIAIFIKYEFWLNYLRELRRKEVRTFIVSAIFRRDSIFFKPHGGIFRRGLDAFERLHVQDEASAALLREIGVWNVTVGGDTRFDRVARIARSAAENQLLERFAASADLLVAGSTWPPDEALIKELIKDNPDTKFLIAPHEVGEERVAALVAALPCAAVRYTQCRSAEDAAGARVMVLDTIGILSSAYRYGRCAYIGGGFGVGIHNTLEAVTWGLPVSFGPNYSKFREARELAAIGVATPVEDYAALSGWFSRLSSDSALWSDLRGKALEYIEENTGATSLFMQEVIGPE